ncbi:MSMEG_0567/sll0787 family protein [Cryobacterium arcticum]|uniref:AIR synthase n=1 Tax=Cryobacterium arcticum TaxID=670052 RepID=A0A1B1BKX4_9MICO|nr:MSMEG_0567/sll0787 family protein [Cryobacterium arcticum]ANP73178.1 AIR synthase [Cryobacterium arcticum]
MQVPVLEGAPIGTAAPRGLLIEIAQAEALAAYRALRTDVFVQEQGLFPGSDLDDIDDDPRTVVLVARNDEGSIVGGVRIAPAVPGRDLGWWTGSRLAVARGARGVAGIGGALIRAACAEVESRGVLRFEATVQSQNEVLFRRLGWIALRRTELLGKEHTVMRWPITRLERAAQGAKAHLATLLQPFGATAAGLGGAGFVGDDGSPVPGSDLIAVCDAIVPSLVERDPEWAGWCAVLVNVNDLTAMGANAVGMLDAVAARDASFAARILRGLQSGAEAWGIPVLGGHTQLGVSAALSVTALGRTDTPVPGGGARPDQALSLTVDISGGWRPGYSGLQWDSSSHRTGAELRDLAQTVARARPAAAKDVSMAGLVGTVGMLAEASGVGAIVDVAAIPRPHEATIGDWLTCFPGFGMLTVDDRGGGRMASAHAVTAEIGETTTIGGVHLRWPDGEITRAIASGVTGLGPSA